MKKMLGEERRYELLSLLKVAGKPITGTDLAKHANVSRQVIVNDMNLLKARNEPIIATSQGYLYMPLEKAAHIERKIVCTHSAENALDEMYTIVDCGVTINNVIVEHAVYGEITASIMVSNRPEVDAFVKRVKDTKANYLSILTDGTHMHMISAPAEDLLNLAEERLRDKGYLVEN
ncbi:transcription repressor NadR [Metasolibacillus sp. FSL H7-0170]|uniref:transcription repressor NadR n=1 Tax=Metasolibacillus TaxID=2703677 RepID=UPI000D38B307|nr:transcription repressor NadR [Metasolibacillus fluoroglycofenilyticus]